MLQVVTVVNNQIERASDIINRLREFGRKSDFKKELVCINTTIKEVMAIIGRQLTLQNIHVDYDLDDAAPMILANKNRLEQIIFNLVTNARDAIQHCPVREENGEKCVIKITSRAKGNAVVFSITDTGIGIPEDTKEKIFEPFFTTKDVGKGMGLGLAITYGIVRDFGGTIAVDSHPGKGTCFTIQFPRSLA
jgi:signal transduction histidine kinase